MADSELTLSKLELSILLSLLENCRKSDSEISREIGASRNYVNRTRKRLEEEDIISGYIPVINIDKIGIDVFVTVLFHWEGYDDEDLTENMLLDLGKDPNVIYLSVGEGSGYTIHVLFGFHDLTEARVYLKELRKKYGKQIGEIILFFAPSDGILKQSYTDIIKREIKERRG